MSNDTDRTLLERAAKAADIFLTPEKMAKALPKWDWCETDEPYFTEHGAMVGTVVWYGSDGVELGGTDKLEWDPLNDDGDEARLEGAMCFNVSWGMASVTVDSATERYSDHGGDKQKARRRAGVRAAAEIGGE